MPIPTIKTILYATALRPTSRQIFRYALSLVRQYDARMVMLHVVEPVGEMGNTLINEYLPEDLVAKVHDEGVKSILKDMEKRVTLFCEKEIYASGQKFDQPIESLVVVGDHADSILKIAKEQDADLIIMGRDPRWGSHTTRHVIRNAKIPVTVVPKGM